MGNKNIARFNAVIDWDKCPPTAGAGDTFTCFDNKECAVVCALDHTAAAVKKLVFDPFERNTQVRAAIAIEINFTLLFDRKQFVLFQGKALTATLGDVGKGTEPQLVRCADRQWVCRLLRSGKTNNLVE